MTLAVSNPFTVQVNPSGGGSTALETLAATLAVGQWAELTTFNFTDMLVSSDPGAGDSAVIEYTDKLVRHNSAKVVYFLGCARGGTGSQPPDYECGDTSGRDAGYIKYDEATNSWSEMPTAPVCSAPHAYQHHCINQATGERFYHESGQATPTVECWHLTGGSWVDIGRAPTTGGTVAAALEWFPEMGKLVYIDGGDGFVPKIWTRTVAGSWSAANLSSSFPIGGYCCFGLYSAGHGCVYFGGGVSSPAFYGGDPHRVLCKLDSSGVVTRMADSPAGVDLGVEGTNSPRTCIDPVTGNLLVFKGPTSTPGTGRVWSFNGAAWTQHGFHPLGQSGPQMTAVFCPSAGVVMAVNFNPDKVWLYRHA